MGDLHRDEPGGAEHGTVLVIDEVPNLPLCPGCSQAVSFRGSPFYYTQLPSFLAFSFFLGMGRGFSLMLHSMKAASSGSAGGS